MLKNKLIKKNECVLVLRDIFSCCVHVNFIQIITVFDVLYNFLIYRDTICDLGGASELANYGEYSGAPSEQQTYEYAKTVLGLMTQDKHPQGSVAYNNVPSLCSVLYV